MAEIGEFKNIHQGEEVFILGNAITLLDHKDFLDSLPNHNKIGINSSNEHIQADYHCLVDGAAGFRFVKHKNVPKYVFYIPGAIQAEVAPKCERVYLNPKVNSQLAWSHDLEQYVQVCRATVWVALQLANYMGFSYAYMMGFELQGKRIPGHIYELDNFLDDSASTQLQLMGYLRGLIDCGEVGMKVFNPSTTSRCRCFPFIHLKHRDVQREFLYKAKPPDINISWDY